MPPDVMLIQMVTCIAFLVFEIVVFRWAWTVQGPHRHAWRVSACAGFTCGMGSFVYYIIPDTLSEQITCSAIFAVLWILVFRWAWKVPGSRKSIWRACVAAGFLCSLGLFAHYIWPTPWRYWSTDDFDYRTNRRTGLIEQNDGTWVPMPGATEAGLQEDARLPYEK
ncbi:MAG: hypothetical protein ACLQVD_06625 [Capsulimonadaceae bacterium]